MKIEDVRRTAYSMPLTNPSFPPGPYRFFNREYFVITYRTDPDALAAVVPEPLEVTEPIVKYEFIRMPDSTGFGDYTETGQVIPVRLNGEEGAYTHAMYLDDDAPIARGRERCAGGLAALRLGALCLRHHGLQAPSRRS
jgi:acetoacetate decarboxylase